MDGRGFDADQSFTGALSTTDFESASLEVPHSVMFFTLPFFPSFPAADLQPGMIYSRARIALGSKINPYKQYYRLLQKGRDRCLCICADEQDIQEVGRARIWEAYLQLVQALTSSELVELPAKTGYRHCSSAVLLRGSLCTSGNHCSVVSKTATGAQHGAKAVSLFASAYRCTWLAELAWGWCTMVKCWVRSVRQMACLDEDIVIWIELHVP